MGQTKGLPPFFALAFFVLFHINIEVSAQNVCGDNATIVIQYPESVLNITITEPVPVEFIQTVLTNGNPARVQVNPDASDKAAVNYPFDNYFRIAYNPSLNATQVLMIKGIDRDGATSSTEDDVNILQYQLVCYPNSAAVTTNSAQFIILKIQILDVNDNTPIFEKAPYSISVNELTPVGVTVFRGISATDLDEGPNKQIFYIFDSGTSPLNLNGTQFFNLPSEQEGIVGVLSPLDFESMYTAAQGDVSKVYYNITVTARDNANNTGLRRSAQTTLKITITDGDDQGPEFIYPSCIPSSQLNSKSCIRPKYLTSVISGNSSAKSLEFIPDPANTTNPTTVFILMQDRDTLNSNVSCNIRNRTEPPGYESYFSASYIPQYSGKQSRCLIDKVANKPLYRTNMTSLELVIEAVELSPTARVDYATVVVSVELANLNPPIITYNSNTGYIYENSPVGARTFIDATANTTLLKLTFTDPDRSASDPQVQFTITTNPATTFDVTQDGYVVLTSAALDYETKNQYIFTVTVTKPTSPFFSASTTVTINVLDLNDNSPIFTAPENYITSVPQGDYATPQIILSVLATDLDFGPPEYTLTSVAPSNATNKFAVNPNGSVSLQGSVRAGEVYRVYVTATDKGSPARSTQAVVLVTVTPPSNQAPFFSANQYIIYVSEGVLNGSSLFTLPVSDPDTPFSSLTFTLSQESPAVANTFFSLNGATLVNVRTFDRESIPEHNITVTVRDPNSNTAFAQVIVRITDINDNNPTFTPSAYLFNVTEGQAVGTLLGSVLATDNDLPNSPNSAITYSIVLATDSNLFNINAGTGQLTTNYVFDYEVKKQYIILVKASDGGSPSRDAVVPVTVNILDVNDNIPLFEDTSREFYVYENIVNAPVVSLLASDADSTPSITFVLRNIGGNTDSDSFNVQTIGNRANITVKGSLDYETKNLYQFILTTVEGQNSASVFASATITVHVLDVNDNSPIIGTFNPSVTVPETASVGSGLVTIPATDSDSTAPNNVLQYSISSTSPSSNLFYIQQNGTLFVANSLQLERTINVYTVNVLVSDRGIPSLSSSATVTVNIVRNRPPTFNATSYTSSPVDENAGTNTVVTSVTATDPDTGGQYPQFAGLTYSLLPDSKIISLFHIDSVTGTIRVNSNLASVTDNALVLSVIATDGGGLTATATVTVSINRNLYSPEFLNVTYVKEIPENFALGDSIVQLVARDLDANSPWNSLVYTIDSDPLAQQYFLVNSDGILRLKQSLALTNISEFNMVISLQDRGTPPRSGVNKANVKVIVTRNLLSPIFFNETYRVTIPENQGVASSIIKVSATDADVKYNKLVYSIVGDQTAASYFNIDPNDGTIKLAQALTGTPINSFVIRVVATDDGPVTRSGSALVFVDVTRNLQKPNWIAGLSNSITIPENTASGISLYKVSATDADSQPPNNQIDYYIISGGEYFQVDPSTGDLKVKVPVFTDPTNATSYQVTLVARDRGTPSLQSDPFTITVNVQRNLYAPRWVGTPYNFGVSINVADNALVQTLNARDDDAAPFNQLSFDIIPYPGSSSSYFIFTNAGATSVDLRVVNGNSINIDTQTQYYLYVRVQDNGSPRKYDIALVTITVNRNSNPPRFTTNTKTITINENNPLGGAISDCSATDSDPGLNGEIVYSLVSSQPASNYFQVLETTGNIIVQRDLHLDTSSSYVLYITARDRGTPALVATSTCTLTVNVDRNLYPPVFVDLPYDRTLNTGVGINAAVVDVNATDADTVSPFNIVNYEIVRQTVDGAFALNRVTGLLTVNSSLTQSSYTIAVRAYDGGSPPLSAYNVFVVTVDGNLQSPQFQDPGAGQQYTKTVEVLETIGLQTQITSVSASDGDTGIAGQVNYYLVGNNAALMYFLVNPDTGAITLRTSLLLDTALQYTLNIIARDKDPIPRQSPTTATVIVNVYRNTYTPQFTTNCSRTVNENLVPPQTLTSVAATDSDRQNTFEKVSYEIIGDGDAPGYIQFSNTSGIITLTSSLSNSAATILYLRVRAFDNGVPPKTSTTVCAISINKNLNTPQWTNTQYTYTVNEEQGLYVPIGQLAATDGDFQAPYNTVTYFYSPVNSAAIEYFRVTPDGEVSAIKSLIGSSQNSYTWTMGVSDRGTPPLTNTVTATVTVNILRNNNPPSFTNCPTSQTLQESAAVGTSVFQLLASDSDPPTSKYGNITLQIIGDDNAGSFFTLNSQNYIVLNRNLATDNATRYQLRVQVADQGSPPRSSLCVFSVNVNRNVNAPQFSPAFYNITILETQPIASTIVYLTATDADRIAPYNQFSCSFGSDLLATKGVDYFTVTTVNNLCNILILRDLSTDLKTNTNYRFTVLATDGGSLQSLPATVNVTVIRNTAPTITNLDRNITINYNASTTAGNVIYDVDYTDPDNVTPFNVDTFSIIGESAALSYFQINPSSGVVSLQQSLVGSGPDSFRVNVRLCDGGNLCDSKTLVINVNRNLFAPTFGQALYQVTIPEDQAVLSSILTVQASDADLAPPYNSITYRMVQTNDRFSVDSDTGIIRVKSPLTGETISGVSFNMEAVDGGRLVSVPVTVIVNITRDQYSPVFSTASCDQPISANINTGALVLTVTATDNDTLPRFGTASIRYSLIGDDGAPSFFNIDSTNGQITVRSGLTSNSADIYKLRVEARDGLGKTDVKVCTVTVTRNLNDPRFDVVTYNARILETQPIGVLVTQVRIADADTSAPSNQGNFSLSGNADCIEYMQINEFSGIISVKKDLRLNLARPTLYTCTITASDRGVPPRSATNTATATVTVVYNTAPYFDKDVYIANISRTVTDNTLLVTYAVTDNDVDAPFNSLFVYISGGNDARFFRVDNQLKQIFVKNTADMALESDSKYEVFITVVDGGSPPLNDTAVITLYVTRNIATPTCVNPNLVTINYTKPLGVPVVVVNATDADPVPPMNTVTYSLVNSAPQILQYWLIDPSTGSLSLRAPLPSSGVSGFQIQVVARDGGFPSLSSICSVQINVNTDSDRLRFDVDNRTVDIPETMGVNTAIVTMSASPTPDITFSVIGMDTAPTYFDVVPGTGQVIVKRDLRSDPAKRLQYILLVKAIKTFRVTVQEATGTVTINVQRNQNRPALSNSIYETTINNDAFIGTSTIQISATDADNDTLLYTVQAPTAGSDYFSVSATTGLISVARPLSTIPVNTTQFNVIVSDQFLGTPKSATATIIIHIVGDRPPYFVNPNTYNTNINFNQAANSNVFTVTATDPDLQGSIVYESNCGLLSAPSYFGVNSSTGSIYLRSSLTTDPYTTSYQLCLVAYDSVRPNNRATATMTIGIYRNPSKPSFTQTNYVQTVYETAPYGTNMFNLTATDPDGQNVEYKMLSWNPSNCIQFFNLHPNTGQFTTAGNLYLSRSNTQCTFQFTVNDVATPSLSADVQASGVITFVRNDFTPAFPNAEYTITIDETLASLSQVFDVNATDGDAPEKDFGDIEYLAIGDDAASNFFSVNPSNGVITLIGNLRTDNTPRFNVRVVARDNGQPRLSGTTLVHINVNRNLYSPLINNNQGTISITVFEDDPIVNPIFSFNFTDQDSAGPQQTVTWGIQFNSVNDQRYFTINQQGQVYISVPLYWDDSNKTPYTFTVTATNNDGSGKSGSISCTVNVNRNLFPPRFSQSVYTVNISSSNSVPVVVTAGVSSSDQDTFARYQVLKYEIINDGVYSQLFSIENTTGLLRLIQPIDQRTENTYKFEIRVLDGGTPQLSDVASVVINVNRNIYRPEFLVGNQTLTLYEDQATAVITRVTAKDNDVLSPFNQFVFTQVTISNYFATDSVGQIYLKSSLNVAGTPDNFILQIRVCDLAPQPLCSLQDAYVFINVIRNRAPYFLNTPYVRTLQTLSVGDNVLNATAKDDDDITTRFGQISFDLIGDDGAESRFSIDKTSGRITATSVTGGSQGGVFRIRIRVCDGGNLCNTTVGIVSISSNLYPPTLDKPSYLQQIPETQPYGETIITVTTNDRDATAPNNVVECELLNGTSNDRSLDCFGVNPTFGLIFAKRSIREPPCNGSDQYNFKVRCSDKGSPVLTSSPSDVTITIVRNQNPPRWDRAIYNFTIPMNLTVNTVVGTIRATDADPLSPFGTLSYSIIGGANGNTYFTISPIDNNNVNVILSNTVSNTFDQDYQILVLVQDSGIPRRQDLTEVNIHVNRGLNPPFFTTLVYNFQAYENDPLGITIGTLLGADNDLYSPWKDYYFRQLSADSYFAISPNGAVYAYKDLTLDTTFSESYTLTAQIYDGGFPSLVGSLNATINIRVFRNRNCPRFTNLPNSITINRNTTVGTVIYRVQAVDNDTNSRFNRTTIEGFNDNLAFANFDFDFQTGEVKVKTALDSSPYLLRFLARDGYCDPISGLLTVNVVRNLSPPQWSKSSDNITILEIQDTGSSIYNLNSIASDPDSPVFSYEFAPGSPNTNRFYFDAQGRIYLSRTLVGQTGDPYQVQFRLNDGALTSSVFTLTVNVIRNHAPTLTINPVSIPLDSSTALNSEVFRCTGSDPDLVVPFSQFKFSLLPDFPVSSIFTVDPVTCAVRLSNSLNFNSQGTYTLRIQILDDGTPQLGEIKSLNITVNRNLARPIFTLNQYTQTILEIKPVGETILNVSATDSDVFAPNNQVTYALVNPGTSQTADYFEVNPVTGAVYSKRWQVFFPDKTITTFTFDVSATDNGVPQLTATANARVTITVIRNTAPFFTNTNTYQRTISKNYSEGTSVFTVTYGDNDQVDPFNKTTLSIRGDGSAPSFFEINQNGVISLKNGSNLLTSSINNFTIRIQVQDAGIPPLSAEAFVYINVTRNFYPPVLQSLTVRIPYTSGRGAQVTTLKATDQDQTGPEGTVRYQILSGSLLNSINYFFLHPETGDVTLIDNTNLVNIDNFTMIIRVYDLGTPSLDSTATLTVIIQKDASTFTVPNYNWTVNENISLSSVVGSVLAFPSDSVTYSVVGFPPATNFFNLSGSSGQIVVIKNLTGDPITQYTMIVRASRNGLTVQSADSTVVINVLRNLNAPVCNTSTYNVPIPDITDIGSVVTTVFATDADQDVLEYSFFANSGDFSYFYIHPRTGVITLIRSLIGTTVNTYAFQVQVRDNKQPEKFCYSGVAVSVLRDLYPPRFSQQIYTGTVSETSQNGSVITTVTATDEDLKGRLAIEVTGISTAPAFFGFTTINQDPLNKRATADIILQDSAYLHQDTSQTYSLRLITYDTAYPNSRATSTVSITAVRNPNAPTFNLTNYETTIYATQQVGSVLFSNIGATDRDGDSPLRYTISGDATALNFYEMNPDTAVIRLKASLLNSNSIRDVIQLSVSDQRNPAKFGSATAIVNIIRDTKPPRFTNIPNTINIDVARTAASQVFTLSAIDDDIKGNLTYTLISGYADFFSLANSGVGNNAVGLVTLARQLREDALRQTTYQLRFRVYDNVFPDSFDEKVLTVTTVRNPNHPVCKDPTVVRTIDINTKVGDIIYTMNATDSDGDTILYTFDANTTDADDRRYFYVDPTTGQVKLIDVISTSGITSFAFTVIASDQAYPSPLTCATTMSFTVTAADKAPYFVPVVYNWSIPETAYFTLPQITVNGFDDDRVGNLQYRIIGNYSAPLYFGVRRNSSLPASNGTIYVQENIKPDNDLVYQIVVVVYDDARPQLSGTATVSVSVTRNPSSPVFSLPSYNATFHELEPIGYNPVNVSATDADGDTITYSFVRTGVDQKPLQYFDIHPLTGRISVMKRVYEDPDKSDSYILTVQASDNRQPPNVRQANVTLSITRNKYHPIFRSTPYNVPTLSESTPTGTIIYRTVTATDQDARGPLVYEEISNTTAAYYFNIDRNNASITLVNSLLAGNLQTYQLYVRTYDPEYPLDYVDEVVNIPVNRNEYAPVFDSASYAVTINETDPVGRNILTVHAKDNNTQDIVTYYATGESDTLNLFNILSNGQIIITSSLLGIPKDTYTMNVFARDNGTPQRQTPVTVSITVIRFPGNPVFNNGPCLDTISENRPLGNINYILNVTDTRNLGPLVFEETGEFYPAPYFFNVSNLGYILLTQNLRNSSMKEAQLYYAVRVYDSLRPNRKVEILCNITVLRNQNAPTWTLPSYSAEIKDSHPVYGPVVVVTATDLDPGDVISYSIINETQQRDLSSGPSEYFFIDTATGLISLRKSVKGTNIRRFILRVMACDNGYPQKCITTDVPIMVNYTGIYPVFIRNETAQIIDTLAVNSWVAQLTATDADMASTSSIQYGFVNPPPAYFNLNPDTGNITLAKSVLYDNSLSYQFYVTAIDRADPDRVATAAVTVLVIRNQEGPACRFKSNSISIFEYTFVPSLVLTLTATDKDGDIPEYTLINVSPPQNNSDPIFFMNAKSGQLWLFKSQERTTTTLYNLTVQASDNRLVNPKSDLCYIIVTIILDQPPFYTNPNANRNISEFTNLGVISRVQATDPDLQGQIQYLLVGLYPDQSFFSVNSVTGDINLVRSLTTDPVNQASYT
ncbi:protocadherin Fat 4, partial [Biomphalaria pfeifferi]